MNAPPLLNALGSSWNLGAAVVATAWDADGDSLAFALGDGQVAVLDTRWKRGPRLEARPGGGVNLVPAEVPASRPLRAQCHQGSCLGLAADARGGFLSGGDDGRVVLVPRDGDPAVLAETAGAWVDSVACSPAGTRAQGHGKRLQRWSGERSEHIELPAPATAIAFSPDGRMLAAAHNGGVSLWHEDGSLRRLAWNGYHRSLVWSPDGRYLVTGMQENALHGWRVADGGDIEMGGYPGQPLSLSFTHDGRMLVTSGGTRPVCWPFDPPGLASAPLEAGLPSKTPVSRVACHPRQLLIAAGYHNGAVLLCQPASDAVLFIKASGGGAVNALAWSGNGARLAFGTQEGEFGWLELPAALFRARASQAHPLETTT